MPLTREDATELTEALRARLAEEYRLARALARQAPDLLPLLRACFVLLDYVEEQLRAPSSWSCIYGDVFEFLRCMEREIELAARRRAYADSLFAEFGTSLSAWPKLWHPLRHPKDRRAALERRFSRENVAPPRAAG